MAKKYVYLFSEGNTTMRNLLGGKGANLAEMTNIGMPVPQGFIVTTEACTKYYEDGEVIAQEVVDQIFEALKKTEKTFGKKFGDKENPFLLSVRSGARASMPGMMDTVLNLGLNNDSVQGLIKKSNNERFAYDSYRRFIQMFADVVMEIDRDKFESILQAKKDSKGATNDLDLDAKDMKEIAEKYLELYEKEKGEPFPQDVNMQLLESIKAVFRSWDNPRAIYYRRMHDIPSDWGTAVNVQGMVFGNMGDNCGTGVAFTRNPATGENELYGEFLLDAQGEDVVAGVRTPEPISHLKELMPEIYDEFVTNAEILEKHYKDMQDLEYTIENGKLYMLQTRSGKRTANAAIKIASDLVDEGMITRKEAVMMLDPRQLDTLLHPNFDEDLLKKTEVLARGLPASPGAASGMVYFTASSAAKAAKEGKDVILLREETTPEDIEGMDLSKGILTARGGMTSHAAVVARGMGRPAIVGAHDIKIDEANNRVTIFGKEYKEGDAVSIDGSTGNVYDGLIPTIEAEVSGDFAKIMSWADEYRTLAIRTNADTPKETLTAIEFGAEGIGLCRTEHMFFEADRISAVREMILSDSEEQRRNALEKILPMQQGDFEEIFKALDGRPATIRYLDPPLHEFLPQKSMTKEIDEIAKQLNISSEEVVSKMDALHEFNPMMGHRGCRLAVTYPEIAEMQTKAVLQAAINVKRETKSDVKPEIMIPLVGSRKELSFVKKVVMETAEKVFEQMGESIEFSVGTMIELPRACVTADEIAEEADFFSFGTNDLTQMAYGFSRDDAAKFLEYYYDNKVFESDPFARLDQEGVGKLVATAVELGKKAKPELQLGVCGEHGGDPSSIEFFHNVGLDYVSCSPFRVPIARLAAAQSAIKKEDN